MDFSKDNYVNYLKSHDLFKNVSEDDISRLASAAEQISCKVGQIIFREGDSAEEMYLVIDGALQVVAQTGQQISNFVARIGRGSIVGEISLVSGTARTATVEVVQDAILMKLPKESVLKLVNSTPDLVVQITNLARQRLHRRQLLEILPSFFSNLNEEVLAEIENKLTWVHLNKGDMLFRQGDSSDDIYFLISGRLSVLLEGNNAQPKKLGEIWHGEIVGEMAFFTGEDRSASVGGIQKCILVKLNRSTLEALIEKHPKIMMAITSRLVKRLKQRNEDRVKNSLNIAIVPAQKDISIAKFTSQLKQALARHGDTSHLSRERFDSLVGTESASEKLVDTDPYSVRLYTWLDEWENTHNYNLYESEVANSTWSRCCIDQSDLILIVASGEGKCYLDAQAQQLIDSISSEHDVKKYLVLLQDNNDSAISGTIDWLNLVDVDDHLHASTEKPADFARLARIVSGRAVGVALGGGGARGCAHIGIIRALEEAGIPIDMIGGTSIGSIVGGQYARGWRYDEMLERMQEVFLKIKPHREFTLPAIALTGNKRSGRGGKLLFDDLQIEDLPLSFFCVSASLLDTKAVVHKRGLLRDAVQASASLPGIAPPTVIDDNILIDGGLINNLPADLMKDRCQGSVIAVDVGSEISDKPNVNVVSSPWKVMSDRLLPFSDSSNAITIFDILIGATQIGDADARENVKQIADCYLRPPVEGYSILGFDSMLEIAQCGYDYARSELEGLDKKGLLNFSA